MKTLTMILAVALIGTTAISATIVSEKKIKNEISQISGIPQEPVSKMQSDEYKTYRTDQEKRIAENERKIADLRTKKNRVKQERISAYEDRIDELETKNNELKKRMSTYNKDDGKFDSFRKEFNHDMDELGKSLKDVFKDNVKDDVKNNDNGKY